MLKTGEYTILTKALALVQHKMWQTVASQCVNEPSVLIKTVRVWETAGTGRGVTVCKKNPRCFLQGLMIQANISYHSVKDAKFGTVCHFLHHIREVIIILAS